MHIAVITGGPLTEPAIYAAMSADKVICADGGADFALVHGITPAEVVGDLDSISPDALSVINRLQIPVRKFPVQKDSTDTELILSSLNKEDEITLICPLSGRIDHVIGNLGLLLNYKENGYDITATDGVTDVIPMVGPGHLSIGGLLNPESLSVSLIPWGFDTCVEGLTTRGLFYECNGITTKAGNTLTFSNKPAGDCDEFTVEITSGRLLVVISDNS